MAENRLDLAEECLGLAQAFLRHTHPMAQSDADRLAAATDFLNQLAAAVHDADAAPDSDWRGLTAASQEDVAGWGGWPHGSAHEAVVALGRSIVKTAAIVTTPEAGAGEDRRLTLESLEELRRQVCPADSVAWSRWLAAIRYAMDRERHKLEAAGGQGRGSAPATSPDEVVHLGDGRYQTRDGVVVLIDAEKDVVEALVRLRAATGRQLDDESKIGDSRTVLKRVADKHPAIGRAIKFPGRARSGGYQTTIRKLD